MLLYSHSPMIMFRSLILLFNMLSIYKFCQSSNYVLYRIQHYPQYPIQTYVLHLVLTSFCISCLLLHKEILQNLISQQQTFIISSFVGQEHLPGASALSLIKRWLVLVVPAMSKVRGLRSKAGPGQKSTRT
jgi:hypothetical protein